MSWVESREQECPGGGVDVTVALVVMAVLVEMTAAPDVVACQGFWIVSSFQHIPREP